MSMIVARCRWTSLQGREVWFSTLFLRWKFEARARTRASCNKLNKKLKQKNHNKNHVGKKSWNQKHLISHKTTMRGKRFLGQQQSLVPQLHFWWNSGIPLNSTLSPSIAKWKHPTLQRTADCCFDLMQWSDSNVQPGSPGSMKTCWIT